MTKYFPLKNILSTYASNNELWPTSCFKGHSKRYVGGLYISGKFAVQCGQTLIIPPIPKNLLCSPQTSFWPLVGRIQGRVVEEGSDCGARSPRQKSIEHITNFCRDW